MRECDKGKKKKEEGIGDRGIIIMYIFSMETKLPQCTIVFQVGSVWVGGGGKGGKGFFFLCPWLILAKIKVAVLPMEAVCCPQEAKSLSSVNMPL